MSTVRQSLPNALSEFTNLNPEIFFTRPELVVPNKDLAKLFGNAVVQSSYPRNFFHQIYVLINRIFDFGRHWRCSMSQEDMWKMLIKFASDFHGERSDLPLEESYYKQTKQDLEKICSYLIGGNFRANGSKTIAIYERLYQELKAQGPVYRFTKPEEELAVAYQKIYGEDPLVHYQISDITACENFSSQMKSLLDQVCDWYVTRQSQKTEVVKNYFFLIKNNLFRMGFSGIQKPEYFEKLKILFEDIYFYLIDPTKDDKVKWQAFAGFQGHAVSNSTRLFVSASRALHTLSRQVSIATWLREFGDEIISDIARSDQAGMGYREDMQLDVIYNAEAERQQWQPLLDLRGVARLYIPNLDEQEVRRFRHVYVGKYNSTSAIIDCLQRNIIVHIHLLQEEFGREETLDWQPYTQPFYDRVVSFLKMLGLIQEDCNALLTRNEETAQFKFNSEKLERVLTIFAERKNQIFSKESLQIIQLEDNETMTVCNKMVIRKSQFDASKPPSFLYSLDLEKLDELYKMIGDSLPQLAEKIKNPSGPRDFMELMGCWRLTTLIRAGIASSIIKNPDDLKNFLPYNDLAIRELSNVCDETTANWLLSLLPEGTLEDLLQKYAYMILALLHIPIFLMVFAKKYLTTSAVEIEFTKAMGGHEICLKSNEAKIETGKLYLEEKNGYIAYTVITPKGETVSNTVFIKAPKPFTLGALNVLKWRIFSKISSDDHIHLKRGPSFPFTHHDEKEVEEVQNCPELLAFINKYNLWGQCISVSFSQLVSFVTLELLTAKDVKSIVDKNPKGYFVRDNVDALYALHYACEEPLDGYSFHEHENRYNHDLVTGCAALSNAEIRALVSTLTQRELLSCYLVDLESLAVIVKGYPIEEFLSANPGILPTVISNPGDLLRAISLYGNIILEKLSPESKRDIFIDSQTSIWGYSDCKNFSQCIDFLDNDNLLDYYIHDARDVIIVLQKALQPKEIYLKYAKSWEKHIKEPQDLLTIFAILETDNSKDANHSSQKHYMDKLLSLFPQLKNRELTDSPQLVINQTTIHFPRPIVIALLLQRQKAKLLQHFTRDFTLCWELTQKAPEFDLLNYFRENPEELAKLISPQLNKAQLEAFEDLLKQYEQPFLDMVRFHVQKHIQSVINALPSDPSNIFYTFVMTIMFIDASIKGMRSFLGAVDLLVSSPFFELNKTKEAVKQEFLRTYAGALVDAINTGEDILLLLEFTPKKFHRTLIHELIPGKIGLINENQINHADKFKQLMDADVLAEIVNSKENVNLIHELPFNIGEDKSTLTFFGNASHVKSDVSPSHKSSFRI